MAKRLGKKIEGSSGEFSFHNGEVTEISYSGMNGWVADNLLDVTTIRSAWIGAEGKEAIFQRMVLNQLMPYEVEATEIARNFSCDTIIGYVFNPSLWDPEIVYEFMVADEEGEDVMEVLSNGLIIVFEIDRLLNYYNHNTALYKVAEQMKDKADVFEISLQTRKVLYNVWEDNIYVAYLASFDGEGNVGEFKKVDWDTQIA